MEAIDGRTARALRTREAIVDASIALVDEGDLRPTAPRIAERAKVSVRSVFQHFDDLEGLYAAVGDRLVERLSHMRMTVDSESSIADRIEEVVRQRAILLEAITPGASGGGGARTVLARGALASASRPRLPPERNRAVVLVRVGDV